MLTAILAASVIAKPIASPILVFEVDGRGTFAMELDQLAAPRTCAHILGLAKQKFFDGMLFHRRVDGFVLQGGDPVSKTWTPAEAKAKPGPMGGTAGLGEGGSGKSVKYEKNGLSHVKGSVGIALESPGDNSGDSQFFINLVDNKRLDGKYVVFAHVVRGMDVVERTRRGDLIRQVTVE